MLRELFNLCYRILFISTVSISLALSCQVFFNRLKNLNMVLQIMKSSLKLTLEMLLRSNITHGK